MRNFKLNVAVIKLRLDKMSDVCKGLQNNEVRRTRQNIKSCQNTITSPFKSESNPITANPVQL